MQDLLARLRQRYLAEEITATGVYHTVCTMIETLNNELGE